MAVQVIPGARRQVRGETVDEPLLITFGQEAPRRLSSADLGIEHRLRAAVESVGEPVRAFQGDNDGLHLDLFVKRSRDPIKRRVATALDRVKLRRVGRDPQGLQRGRIGSHDHDPVAAHSAQLPRPSLNVRPVMDGQDGQAGVERVVVERERVGASVDRGHQIA